jgi:NADPH-dependent curcumin reductase CurA
MNEIESYVEPFVLNKPIEGSVVACVKESNSKAFKKNDLVFGQLLWPTDMAVNANLVHRISSDIETANNYLGILGMPGLTAYFGMLKIGKPKPEEVVIMSGTAVVKRSLIQNTTFAILPRS